MKVTMISIPVRDQEKALNFYTDKLGFIKKHDKSMGGGNRWLTLVSKEAPGGPEILLEPAPLHFEPSRIYQDALMEAGIPYTQFEVKSVDKTYSRLAALDVAFRVKPTVMDTTKYAVFDDSCGNFIAITEEIENS